MIKPLTDLSIEAEPGQGGGRRRRYQSKGRQFGATLVAYATADALWDQGAGGDYHRPVYASFAGPEGSLRPFVANLQCGRKACPPGDRRSPKGLEFLKSAGYRAFWQREPEGSVATLYLPELFAVDPGMVDPQAARFVVMAPADYLGEPTAEDRGAAEHVRALPRVRKVNDASACESWERERWREPLPLDRLVGWGPLARLFAARLDRRTRAPIPPDPRFHLQLLAACLDRGLATLSAEKDGNGYRWERFGRHWAGFGFTESVAEGSGLAPGLAFSAAHADLEALLSEEAETYYAATTGGPRALARLEAARERKRESEAAERQRAADTAYAKKYPRASAASADEE